MVRSLFREERDYFRMYSKNPTNSERMKDAARRTKQVPLRNAKVDKYCCNKMYVDKAVLVLYL